MVTTAQLKKALGTRADNLPEEKLMELNVLFERLSNALFERWTKTMTSEAKKKKPL